MRTRLSAARARAATIPVRSSQRAASIGLVLLMLGVMISGCNSSTESAPKIVWPETSIYHGGANLSGEFLAPGPNPDLATTVRWTFQGDGALRAAPAVAGGLAIAGSESGTVYAVDATTGAKKWTFAAGAAIYGTPAIIGDRVIVGREDGRLIALSLKEGKQQWESEAAANLQTSPTASVDRIFIGDTAGRLRALDAETGDEIWSAQLASGLSSAAVDGDELYVRTGGTLLSVSAGDGEERWSASLKSDTGSFPVLTPSAVLIGSADGRLRAFDRQTGALNWSFATGGSLTIGPAVSGGTVVVHSDDRYAYGIDAATGDPIWRTFLGTEAGTVPAIASGVVYVGRSALHLLALSATTGEMLWQLRISDDSLGASPVVVDRFVYMTSSDGRLMQIGQVSCNSVDDWISDARSRVKDVDKIYDKITRASFWNDFDDSSEAMEFPERLANLGNEQYAAAGPPIVSRANQDIADIYFWLSQELQSAVNDALIMGGLFSLGDYIFGSDDEVTADYFTPAMASEMGGESDGNLPSLVLETTIASWGCA
jgi:outer membrane protein assembly factor BamB